MTLTKLPVTPRGLYRYAQKHGLEDCRIRIADGMAVSYFPTEDSVCRSKSGIVLDVSCEPMIEYDELAAPDRVIIYQHNGREIKEPQPPKELDQMK